MFIKVRMKRIDKGEELMGRSQEAAHTDLEHTKAKSRLKVTIRLVLTINNYKYSWIQGCIKFAYDCAMHITCNLT